MSRKPFTKQALSTPDLINFLVAKGLGVSNQAFAHSKINSVGYYRLKIYTRALELPSKQFIAGTTFEDVIRLYEFDRKLRLVTLDAVERIEVALRATIINVMCAIDGSHFYYNELNFEDKSSVTHARTIASKSKHLSINHYKATYHTPLLAPIWCVTEASTFGDISKMFADLTISNRRSVAHHFSIDEKVLVSWFKSINTVRNICAHHNRLWNAELVVNAPTVARAYRTDLHNNNTRVYARLFIMMVILRNVDINCANDWCVELKSLIASNPSISLSQMGFPANWLTRPTWN